jgi:hypothetical protein
MRFLARHRRARASRATTIRIASMRARSVPAADALRAVATFLRGLVKSAEQLTDLQLWREILARSVQAVPQGPPSVTSAAVETG